MGVRIPRGLIGLVGKRVPPETRWRVTYTPDVRGGGVWWEVELGAGETLDEETLAEAVERCSREHDYSGVRVRAYERTASGTATLADGRFPPVQRLPGDRRSGEEEEEDLLSKIERWYGAAQLFLPALQSAWRGLRPELQGIAADVAYGVWVGIERAKADAKASAAENTKISKLKEVQNVSV